MYTYAEDMQLTEPPQALSAPHSADPHTTSPPSQEEERRDPPIAPHGLNARSCVTCRRRKVKCDKKNPCSNCVKAHVHCVFPAPGRAPRKPRSAAKPISDREAELLKRLRRLEGVVEELSGHNEVEQTKRSPSSDTSSLPKEGDHHEQKSNTNAMKVVGMDEGSGSRKAWISRAFSLGNGPPRSMFDVEKGIGRLVLDEGKSHYVSNPFWGKLLEEVQQIRGMIDSDSESDEDFSRPAMPSAVITAPDHQGFILGYSSSDVNLKGLHPLPSQIPFYWETFLENVHPLTKLIHAPTMSKFIKEVQNNLDSLNRSTEALMFAIYFATITSMNLEEVRTNFGVSKDYLLKQYRFGVEQALARAGLLNTDELVTVQAFILFLVCVRRHDDTRFVWSLTGLAMRIAQSLGLHRDGAKFGLSPFDTEMRRRLWWHICILDVRASEDHGSEPMILDQAFDTEFPTNVNDDDLKPEATEPPAVREGPTEMTFCLIRYEICALTRRLQYASPGDRLQGGGLSLEEKEQIVRETAERMEERYLYYCQDAGPLCWVAATVARLILAKSSLIIYHPLTQPGKPSTLPADVTQRLFIASIEILEYSSVLEEEASTKKWGWLYCTYVQWHAIAFLLGELAIRPQSPLVNRAWRAVDRNFVNWGGMISKNGVLWQPMRILYAKARRTRQNYLHKGDNLASAEELIIDKKHPARSEASWSSADSSTIAQQRKAPQHTGSLNPSELINTNGINPIKTESTFTTAYNTSPIAPRTMQPQMLTTTPLQPAFDPLSASTTEGNNQMAWTLDDTLLQGFDVNALQNEDVNWEGWGDMVRDFSMEIDAQAGSDARGPNFASMGTWW